MSAPGLSLARLFGRSGRHRRGRCRNERDCARGTPADLAVIVDDRAHPGWVQTVMRLPPFGFGGTSAPRPTAVKPDSWRSRCTPPRPLPERTGQRPRDSRRHRSNCRRSCPHPGCTLHAALRPLLRGFPAPPDGLPLSQTRRQERVTPPKLLPGRTGPRPLDCRRRRSNRQRSCQYSLAGYRPS